MDAERAAKELITARERRQQTRTPLGVRSFKDAYEVQDAFVRLWDGGVAGHKVGCSSAESQRLVGSPGPIAGRLFRDRILASPAIVAASEFFLVGVEAEFGFRIGRDLPPRDRPYGREEVENAISALVPLIEICDTRLADWKTRSIEEITADNAFHGAVVIASELRDWKRADLRKHEVTLSLDGEIRGRGTGALVLGDPVEALIWLANDLSARGHGIGAGNLIAAGTCTGLHFADPKSDVLADFGALGRVEVHVKL
jgi:2-keto-4-pentenoate hydratase